MSGEAPPKAFVSLVRRNRRRYGGYIVHLGIALLFVGVAASTAFEHERDVRLKPGETTTLGDYEVEYVRATGDIDVDGAGNLEKIDLGAVVEVRRDGKTVATVRPERGYYPSQDMENLGMIGRFFEGEATSEIGLDAGAWSDIWIAVQPDVAPLRPLIDKGDKLYAESGHRWDPQLQAMFLGRSLGGLVQRYVDRREYAAQFRMIASPLVSWIWIGAIVTFGGGLIALWPAPDAARRRATARAAARVAQDLGRA